MIPGCLKREKEYETNFTVDKTVGEIRTRVSNGSVSNDVFGSALYTRNKFLTPNPIAPRQLSPSSRSRSDPGPLASGRINHAILTQRGRDSPVRRTKCKISSLFLGGGKPAPDFKIAKAGDFGVRQDNLRSIYPTGVANGPGLSVVRVGLVTWTVGLMCHARWSETRRMPGYLASNSTAAAHSTSLGRYIQYAVYGLVIQKCERASLSSPWL